jgi:hypothetical protein
MNKLERLLNRLKPKVDPYVIAQCTSSKLNPMFQKPTPLAWQHIIDRSAFDEFKAMAEAKWPDVKVTLIERTKAQIRP